ncbi:hypothetical protein [Sphingobacterium hungaricum]|uniref:Uncharacterized protein n=1 Tax=Sphingobacterium hungaricum TaxID=2082723 RepID=A0A928YRY5_9SPHI|nr:hypothetical protein [Sphingobacterium hungaricum]MBE8715454.1 hypothetical protein [Sphingobacterium hungaricum]
MQQRYSGCSEGASRIPDKSGFSIRKYANRSGLQIPNYSKFDISLRKISNSNKFGAMLKEQGVMN